jgi:TonB family protein
LLQFFLFRVLRTLSKSILRFAALGLVALIWPIETVTSEDLSKARRDPKVEYIRLEAGNDPLKASRNFSAKWRAVFVVTPRPDYPYEARRNNIGGKGLLRIYVDETGKVTDVKVLQSTGNRQLDTAGLIAFRHWRAKPGTRREVDMPLTFVAGRGPGSPGDNGMGSDGLGIMKSRDR